MPRKTIESIDSSKDKSSVPEIFEQITFVVRNPYEKDIVKKTKHKKQKQRKERTKFAKLHFGEYNKLLQPVLLRFCVKGKGKHAFSMEIFWFLLLKITVIYCKTYFAANS